MLTLIYTSGTTGPPKGVEITHRGFFAYSAGLLDNVPNLKPGSHVISWLPSAHIAERDAHHYLPLLCGMVFEHSGLDLTRTLAGLKLVLKHETKATVSIATLAQNIDSGVADIRLIALSRAILGPMHLPGITDDGDYSALRSVKLGSDIVIEITVDHTHSVSVRKPTTLAVRFGVSPAEQQVYAIRTQDPLCYGRGADTVERIVILPHRMLQGMRPEDKKDDMGAFTLVPYIKEGELQ